MLVVADKWGRHNKASTNFFFTLTNICFCFIFFILKTLLQKATSSWSFSNVSVALNIYSHYPSNFLPRFSNISSYSKPHRLIRDFQRCTPATQSNAIADLPPYFTVGHRFFGYNSVLYSSMQIYERNFQKCQIYFHTTTDTVEKNTVLQWGLSLLVDSLAYSKCNILFFLLLCRGSSAEVGWKMWRFFVRNLRYFLEAKSLLVKVVQHFEDKCWEFGFSDVYS